MPRVRLGHRYTKHNATVRSCVVNARKAGLQARGTMPVLDMPPVCSVIRALQTACYWLSLHATLLRYCHILLLISPASIQYPASLPQATLYARIDLASVPMCAWKTILRRFAR